MKSSELFKKLKKQVGMRVVSLAVTLSSGTMILKTLYFSISWQQRGVTWIAKRNFKTSRLEIACFKTLLE